MVTDINVLLLSILPEISLTGLIFLVLALDLVWARKKSKDLGWVVFWGLVLIMAASLIFVRYPDQGSLTWGGMLRMDGAGFIFRMLFLAGGAITVLFSMEHETIGRHGEFYLLLLVSVLGMTLMASAADLIMLYLAIETTSIPLFVLTGFLVREPKSVESGVKYVLFGAMSSAIMLFGFTWLFGFTGTTQLYDIATILKSGGIPGAAVVGALLMVLVGFGFKMSIAPFHFWAPDVYEGSPTPVAGFLSTASKAAGFAILIRTVQIAFPDFGSAWSVILAVLATLSMVIGNFLALAQKDIKRLLAYSSIAQAGYILIGVASNNQFGTSASLYYLMAYLVTNLAAFGIVALVGKSVGSDDISSYAGLSRRSPKLALALLVAILSLGGIPPFAGFFGKLLVFTAAIQANLIWLAFIGVANAVVGLYYYLNALKVVYLYRSENEEKPMPSHWKGSIALIVCIVGVIVLGIVMAPWFDWASSAVLSLAGQ